MKSQLSRSQFFYKLESNVLEGYPSLKGTPISFDNMFHSKEKYFFGRYDENRFQITKNCGISDLTDFILEGEYDTGDDNFSAEVSYRIKPMWFPYLWIRAMPLICAFAMSIIIFLTVEDEIPYTIIAIIWDR